MMFNKEVLFAHTRVLLATGAGIAGMGITFNGAMQGNLIEMSRGVPLLLLGVWWAGRVLGQSMIASRRRRLPLSPGHARARFQPSRQRGPGSWR